MHKRKPRPVHWVFLHSLKTGCGLHMATLLADPRRQRNFREAATEDDVTCTRCLRALAEEV